MKRCEKCSHLSSRCLQNTVCLSFSPHADYVVCVIIFARHCPCMRICLSLGSASVHLIDALHPAFGNVGNVELCVVDGGGVAQRHPGTCSWKKVSTYSKPNHKPKQQGALDTEPQDVTSCLSFTSSYCPHHIIAKKIMMTHGPNHPPWASSCRQTNNIYIAHGQIHGRLGPTRVCRHRHPSKDFIVWRWLEECRAAHYTHV